MALLLGLAIVGFGAHVAGSPFLLGVLVVEGSLVFIALGFAIASFAQTNQTAMALGNIITMPMMFLSGVFFPTDSFPKFVQPLIKVLPLTYLADAFRQVMMRGAGFDAVSHDMLVMAVYGLVIFLVSVKMFKWE
ncbi:MAG: ABC transporter permease, partial [Chloroflexi bacterium]|nr:ABC transporter permease [Chloroflexota bacterium]